MSKGKAIYQPTGKAVEYAQWACNFYTGCSNGCTYCYCKRGVMAKTWSDTPKLKSCFKDEEHALQIFEKELMKVKHLLHENDTPIFFTFTSDPCLRETTWLTFVAIKICHKHAVRTTILTKCSNIFPYIHEMVNIGNINPHWLSIGFTLTGHDELEPNASTNAERIEEMKKLHDAGFKTWASIEPIISIKDSADMVLKTIGYCDLYKVGLLSGKKYDDIYLRWFIHNCGKVKSKFYFKDSFLKQAKMTRDILPDNCVDRNFNLFNNN